jgi:hypothetical protein
MSQDTPSPRPTFVRTAIVVGAAVIAALGGGLAIAANAPTPRQVVSPPVAPSDFVGVTPVRVLDTRGAAGGPIGVPAAAKLGAGQTIDVAVAGVGAIPDDATSVAVNITIDEDATLKSFLTVWPTGQTRPNTSANNAEPGLVSANSAIFQVGTDGKLSVFNQQGTVNVIMDVTGYFVEDTGGGGTTTTTTPGETTTTTIAPAEPTFTLDAATYDSDDIILFSGAGWSDCGTSVNILLDGAPTAKVVGIGADGTFQSSKLIVDLLEVDNPHTLGAESADAGFTCTATAEFDVVEPAP